jgi:hypothetical protein
MRQLHRLTVATIGVATCIALAACSGSTGTASSSPTPQASGGEITAVVALSAMGRAGISQQITSDGLTDADHTEACDQAAAEGPQALADSILDGLSSGLVSSTTDTSTITGWPTEEEANQAAVNTIDWLCGSGKPTPQSDEEQADTFRTLLVWMTQLQTSGESIGCAGFGQETEKVTGIATEFGVDAATAEEIVSEVVAAQC